MHYPDFSLSRITRVAPHPPASSPAVLKDATPGVLRSIECTVSRSTPVPLPWITRISYISFWRQTAMYSVSSSFTSRGWKVWRSRIPSIGISIASSPRSSLLSRRLGAISNYKHSHRLNRRGALLSYSSGVICGQSQPAAGPWQVFSKKTRRFRRV